MKKLTTTLAALGLIILSSACHMNTRHVVITNGDNNSSTRIEYFGRTYFDGDTAIAHISPRGSVKYKKNDHQLFAESDSHGGIVYQIDDNGKQTHLNAAEKAFLAQAVKDMVKFGHNND